jgi:hypothetical protein
MTGQRGAYYHICDRAVFASAGPVTILVALLWWMDLRGALMHPYCYLDL